MISVASLPLAGGWAVAVSVKDPKRQREHTVCTTLVCYGDQFLADLIVKNRSDYVGVS